MMPDGQLVSKAKNEYRVFFTYMGKKAAASMTHCDFFFIFVYGLFMTNSDNRVFQEMLLRGFKFNTSLASYEKFKFMQTFEYEKLFKSPYIYIKWLTF